MKAYLNTFNLSVQFKRDTWFREHWVLLNFLTPPPRQLSLQGQWERLPVVYQVSALSFLSNRNPMFSFRDPVCPWKDSSQPSLESGVAGWLLQYCVDAQRDTHRGAGSALVMGRWWGQWHLFSPLLLSVIQPWWLEGQPRMVPPLSNSPLPPSPHDTVLPLHWERSLY